MNPGWSKVESATDIHPVQPLIKERKHNNVRNKRTHTDGTYHVIESGENFPLTYTIFPTRWEAEKFISSQLD